LHTGAVTKPPLQYIGGVLRDEEERKLSSDKGKGVTHKR